MMEGVVEGVLGKNAGREGVDVESSEEEEAEHVSHGVHASLLSVGERCVHLICDYVRKYDPEEADENMARELSRLSRTCRRLYIMVRNLPSVLEVAEAHFPRHAIPAGVPLKCFAYWSDVAGVCWQDKDFERLRLLDVQSEQLQQDNPSDGDNAGNVAVNVVSPATLAQMFFSVVASEVEAFVSLDGCAKAQFEDVMQHIGGLMYHHSGSDEPSFVFNVLRCEKLRCLSIDAMDVPFELVAVAPLLRQQQDMLQYSCLMAAPTQTPLPDAHLPLFARLVDLDLYMCEWVTDTGPFNGVRSLALSMCANLTTLTTLSTLHTLELMGCHAIASVEGIRGIHTLELSTCNGITSISNLHDIHYLNVFGCSELRTFENISNVHWLYLSRSDHLETFREISHVHEMVVNLLSSVTRISRFHDMKDVVMMKCHSLTEFAHVRDVLSLKLHDCESLEDVSALANVRELCFRACDKLSDVSSLVGVDSLTLDDCPSVTNVSTLAGIVQRIELK